MNIHHIKCKLNLHDYKYYKEKYDDITIIKKQCIWCNKTQIVDEQIH